MIAVINYGMGNIRSIEKALVKIGAEHLITNKPEDLAAASHIILPGVGFFAEGMKNLNKLNLIEPMKKEILEKKKPFLGICLGMQLLFKSSEEGNSVKGLGFIDGHVKLFQLKDFPELKVPHVGWNQVKGDDFSKIDIFKDIEEHSNFYFVHSYHATLNIETLKCYTDYGYDFISVIQNENVFGTQFHPEKSQKKGLKILKNFAEIKC